MPGYIANEKPSFKFKEQSLLYVLYSYGVNFENALKIPKVT